MCAGSCSEAGTRRYSVNKVFLEILQSSQKNACARVFLDKVAGWGGGDEVEVKLWTLEGSGAIKIEQVQTRGRRRGPNFDHLVINNVIIECPQGSSSHLTLRNNEVLSNIK